jgi:hypothetical protein
MLLLPDAGRTTLRRPGAKDANGLPSASAPRLTTCREISYMRIMAIVVTRRGWIAGVVVLGLGSALPRAARAIEPSRRSSMLEVKLLTPLHSAKSKNGDPFDGVVVKDKTKHVPDGSLVAAGTRVKGTVLYAKPGGALKSVGVLTLQLAEVGGVPVESSRFHQSADPLRPSGTEDLALPAGTILTFNVKASSGSARRGR